MIKDPIESLSDLIDSESYNISEKTLMEIENDYKAYKEQIKWTEHILEQARGE